MIYWLKTKKINIFGLIMCLLFLSCEKKSEFTDGNLEKNNEKQFQVNESETIKEEKIEVKKFDLSVLEELEKGGKVDLNNLKYDVKSISEYIVKGYLAGDSYTTAIDYISYKNILLFIMSSRDENEEYSIEASKIIYKESSSWEFSHLLIKKSGQYRDDIIVIVDNNDIVEAYGIDIENRCFNKLDISDIQLIREE